MNCIYCNNQVKPGPWHRDVIYLPFHGAIHGVRGDEFGWCYHHSLPVFFKWKPFLPNDQIIITAKMICDETYCLNNDSCYCIHQDLVLDRTSLFYSHKTILTLNSLIELNPSNFHPALEKLKSLTVFL